MTGVMERPIADFRLKDQAWPVFKGLKQFLGPAKLEDDITLVVIKIEGWFYLVWNDFFMISIQENLTAFGSFFTTVDFLDNSLSRYSWTGSSFSYHIVSSSCIFYLPLNYHSVSADFHAVPFSWKLGFLPERHPKVQPKIAFFLPPSGFCRKISK